MLDWEWCRPGDTLIDLAWCEWIVRTHHASSVTALDAFYSAYSGKAGRLWRDRLTAVQSWT